MAAIDRRLPWRVPWYIWAGVGLVALGAIHVRAPQLLQGTTLFVVLGALVLVLLVGAILWELPPAVMLCGAIALTIFSGNWTQLGLPGFPFVPDRILVVGAILALLLRSPGAAALPHLRVRGVHLLLIATVLYAGVSAVLAGTLGSQASIFGLLDRLGAIPFLMLLVAPAIFAGPRERNWLLATLVGIGAYLGLTAVFETIGPQALVFPRYIHHLDVARGISEAVGPFAAVVPEGFACYGCGVAAIIASFQWRGGWRWIAAAVAFVSLLGSFLSLERGVWIGAVAGGVAVAVFARDVRRWFIPAAAICAVAVTVVLTLSPTLGSATTTRLNDRYPVWDRQNQTAAAFRMIDAKPLFGFGWNNYANTATDYFQLARNYPLTGYPSSVTIQVSNPGPGGGKVTVASRGGVTGALHDSYLTFAVELGLVGAALWLVSVFWGLGGAIFSRGSPELRPWRLGLLALTVCFLVIAAVDPLSQNFTQLLLWTWAGVAVSGTQARAAPSSVGTLVDAPAVQAAPEPPSPQLSPSDQPASSTATPHVPPLARPSPNGAARSTTVPSALSATQKRQRVLMFAYYFPPLGGGGVQRTLKHVKYLPAEGFDSIVVGGARRGFFLRDSTLDVDIPPGTLVRRARALPLQQAQWKLDGLLRRAGLPTRPVSEALWPDGLVGWLPAAVWHGLRAARTHRPDVLYSTSSPTTSHLAALIVHRLTGLPWVADFRDAWALNPAATPASAENGLARATAALESTLIAEASYVTVVDESVELLDLAPGDPRRVVIPNGVDADDLTLDQAAESGPEPGRFRLSHVGSLYGARDAAPVFAAVRELISSGKLDSSTFEFRIVGHASLDGPELDSLPVTFTGYVNHRRSFAEMMSSSALLLYQTPGERGTSGKIYEYLASGRPVLCVAEPDNLAYRLVQEFGAGECVDARDATAVAGALERMFGAWRRGERLAVDPRVREEALRRFSRQRLAADLAGVLRAAIAERRPPNGARPWIASRRSR
jgi:putative inorganic carbon (hco3(-)) transporter